MIAASRGKLPQFAIGRRPRILRSRVPEQGILDLDLDLALADVNGAHRLDPDDRRILRQRSAVYRLLGDTGAERDERRGKERGAE